MTGRGGSPLRLLSRSPPFPSPPTRICRNGNINELRDAAGGPGESSLFFITSVCLPGLRPSGRRAGVTLDSPGIGSPGEGAGRMAKYPDLRGIRSTIIGP